MKAQGVTLFCDDIRFEDNGKAIILGLYGPDMIFNQPPPVILPTFAAYVIIHSPADRQVKKITVSLIGEAEGVDTVLASVDGDITAEPPELGERPSDSTEFFNEIRVPIRLAGVHVDRGTFFKVRAKLDGEELKLGTVFAQFPEPPDE